MRIADLLLCCCATLLAAGCSGQDEAAPATPAPTPTATLAPPKPAPEPKIIVQLGHQAPVLAVRWLHGGQQLASLAQDGSIVIWNVADGSLLDHAQVPLDPAMLLPEGEMSAALGFRVLAEGTAPDTLTIAYAGRDASAAGRACPQAQHPDTPWCTYGLDVVTRVVRADASLQIPTANANDSAQRWPVSPDGKLRPEPNHGSGRRGLPDLADEHFGDIDPTCTSAKRCRYGVTLLATDNSTPPRALTVDPRGYFLDADLSPDGLHLLRVVSPFPNEGTRVDALDLSNGSRGRPLQLARAYHQVHWLDGTRYLLTSEGYSGSDDTEEAAAGFPPALLADAACAQRGDCVTLESRWQTRQADAGALIGLGSLADNCYRIRAGGVGCAYDELRPDDGNETSDPPATGLVYRVAGSSAWKPIALHGLEDEVITAIETSPDHRQLAVATRNRDRADTPDARQVLRVWLMDLVNGGVRTTRRLLEIVDPLADAEHFTDASSIRALSFSADAGRIVFTQTKTAQAKQTRVDLYLLDTDTAAKVRTIPGFSRRAVAIGDNRVLGLDDGALLDLDSGKVMAHVAFPSPLLRTGWIERSSLLWASTESGAILFWDSTDGTLQLTLHTLPDNRYFAIAPGGRYDTNLAADTALVRWLVPDAPWRSLAAQTFMRDYYEPGLYRRLLDCRANESCASAFKPLPAIASLNRVLPAVRISGVRAGRDAAEAVVSMEVREGVDTDAPNGKTRSGVYNPRLFRNGRLVAMTPKAVGVKDADLATWRKRNSVPVTGDVHRLEFTVPLPTQADEAAQVFTAYAFNEDRIKGETATLAWTRPAITPRPRHAYVLAIGIDDYDTPRFRLNYAVADARLMASRLSAVPGYQTHTLVLAGERKTDGQRARVDRATMARVLSLLSGDGDRNATLAALRAAGIDASMLQAATPDDVVIVSYSGHGWANPQGDFYLIPSDGRWPEGAASPELATMFATADLVAPFRLMNAGEIALVIDACHSAASVADGRFKPGPMGDSGLGQLAYDKGIRILAATQADDVALEDARLGQGLLTYALAVDGLTEGDADLDDDGAIRIDEWLAFAVQRMPTLANDARVGRISATGSGARDISFHDLPEDAPARRVQQPALFDFNPQPSAVVLRKGAP